MMSLPCGIWRAWHTPAKINLFLEVLGKRGDGYHEIETLMAPIAVYDTLWFTPHPKGKLALTCRWVSSGMTPSQAASRARPEVQPQASGSSDSRSPWGDLPPEAENLAFRAVALLRARAGIEAGAVMRLVKRIPSAAGLGGASSNAACALRAANEGWGLHWPTARLRELAAELGSDVSFFLDPGPALCRGRGERIEPVTGLPPLHVAVVRPPTGLSTARVYAHCQPAATPSSAASLLHALRSGNWRCAGAALVNRLQEAAERLSPEAAQIGHVLRSLDVWGSQMSGSGSSYFALCRTAAHARRVAAQLRARKVGLVFAAATDYLT